MSGISVLLKQLNLKFYLHINVIIYYQIYTICIINAIVDSNCKTMTSEKNAQVGQAREAFQMLYQISQLLCTGLDAESLSTCIRLCELGVEPEVLALVIKEIRKMGETAAQTKPTHLQS